MGKNRSLKVQKSLPIVVPQQTIHKSERISENRAEYYIRVIEIYFTRIDTNPLAQTAKFRLLDLITRHNTCSSSMERNGLYKMIKHMQNATIVRERRWFPVPYLHFDEMRFFDSKNADGTIAHRNMPLRKKNKADVIKRVDRELQEYNLSHKTGQNDQNTLKLDRNDPTDRRILSLLA